MCRRIRTLTFTVTALAATAAHTAGAQWRTWQADSLLASGNVAAAESLYYAASSTRPRDAKARAALGRYLASRGALRIGAVLLEEARLFGGDSTEIARDLTPIYRALGDYRALAVLPKAPLSDAERSRVSWLVSHPQVLEFADSTATIEYSPVIEGRGLGVVTLYFGERRVDALIDPGTSGLVLRGAAARRRRDLRTFGEDSTGILAVVPELRIGAVVLNNVAALVDTTSSSRASRSETLSILGLDVLRRLAPTFDPEASTLTLRRSGLVPAAATGTRLPILLDESGLRVLVSGRWNAMSADAAPAMLATRRWTLDVRRGEAVVQ